jgi:hydroxyacylglutathione hydrolase
MDVHVLSTPGLGNSSYLLASDGEAVAVDPPRDAWRVATAAEQRGWHIRAVLETHVHNDYLSGARELRRARRARIVAPVFGGYRFGHLAADEGLSLTLGSVAIVARATPGHTPEHLTWEVRDGSGRPLAVFTGGSLLMGGVGRTDLLGEARTAELTSAQFRTLRRLSELPDDVVVYPTHGAGSFCVAGGSDGPASATIGSLRTLNAAFAAPDLETFERELSVGRTRYPAYYTWMAPLNRRGPRLLGGPPRPRPLTVDQVADARAAGARVVDARDRRAFARGHLAGSLNVELGESFGAYVGWLLPFDAPLCLVVDDPADEVEAATELLRIGFDHVLGHLDAGVAAWTAAGATTSSYATVSIDELRAQAAGEGDGPERILDVRQPSEWQAGSVPGSRRVFVADLPAELESLDDTAPWTVTCRSGSRAAIAASLLDAAGIPVRAVLRGGVPWLPAAELVPA